MPYDGGWHPSRPHPPPADALLRGASLKDKAIQWSEGGIIEPDAAEVRLRVRLRLRLRLRLRARARVRARVRLRVRVRARARVRPCTLPQARP